MTREFSSRIALEVTEVETRQKPRSVSWWADYAAPDLPRELFVFAAQQRDREMKTDGAWRRPDKLQQIGQL